MIQYSVNHSTNFSHFNECNFTLPHPKQPGNTSCSEPDQSVSPSLMQAYSADQQKIQASHCLTPCMQRYDLLFMSLHFFSPLV